MKILGKDEMKNIKGGLCPSAIPYCFSSGDCDYCFYWNGDITEVCVTVLDDV
jgi:hypothetical protein